MPPRPLLSRIAASGTARRPGSPRWPALRVPHVHEQQRLTAGRAVCQAVLELVRRERRNTQVETRNATPPCTDPAPVLEVVLARQGRGRPRRVC